MCYVPLKLGLCQISGSTLDDPNNNPIALARKEYPCKTQILFQLCNGRLVPQIRCPVGPVWIWPHVIPRRIAERVDSTCLTYIIYFLRRSKLLPRNIGDILDGSFYADLSRPAHLGVSDQQDCRERLHVG